MKRFRILSLVLTLLFVISCLCFDPGGGNGNGGGNGGGNEETNQQVKAVGQITKEHSLVRAGPSSSMEEVANSRDLENNDAVNVSEGGKAQLDFDGGISFRLFNDSSVGGIKAELDPNTPPRLSWKLIRGGGVGQVVEEGSELTISVSTGTNFTILGTSFFVVFDDDSEYLTIGKIEGEIVVEIPGEGGFYLDNEIIDIAPDGSTRAYPLPPGFDLDFFENVSDSAGSPLFAMVAIRKEFGIPYPEEPEPEEKPISSVYRGLVRVELDPIEGNAYLPDLAVSWEVNDDASFWTFYLMSGVTLESGDPFTSYAFLERFDESEFVQEGWGSVEPIDDYTFGIFIFDGDAALAKRGYDYSGFLELLSELTIPTQLGP